MLISWIHLIALIACAGLCGGCIALKKSPAQVAMPHSTHVNPAYGPQLHAALNRALAGLELPVGNLSTTITSIDEPDTLRNQQGITCGTQLRMTVQAAYVAAGKTVWQGTVTGSTLILKPMQHNDYAHAFAHARQNLCYDVAHQIKQQLLTII